MTALYISDKLQYQLRNVSQSTFPYSCQRKRKTSAKHDQYDCTINCNWFH